MSRKIKAVAALALGAVLTIATSPALDRLSDSKPLDERVLTPDDPYSSIKASIGIKDVPLENVIYVTIEMLMDFTLTETADEKVQLRLYVMPEGWTPNDGLSWNGDLVDFMVLSDPGNPEWIPPTWPLYAEFEGKEQTVQLVLLLVGDATVTLSGEVVATAAIYPAGGESPEDAHVILHLDQIEE